jgi:hypothetical protein
LLQYHPKNMHVHSDEQIERLCELIKYQGWRNPIIVQKGTNLVVAGNGRLMAAKRLGIEKVPVIEQEFESEAQLYAYMVSDNAIGKDTWATLDLAQVNLEVLDFGPDFDIDMLAIKDFSIIPDTKFEMEEELKEDMNKKYLLEIQFPNDMEMQDIHDDLVSRGYLVKIK